MDPTRIVGVLNARKWTILLSVIVTLTLVWGAMRLTTKPKWTAMVQFVANPSATVGSSDDGETTGAQAAQTQAIIYTAIMKSADVLEPTQQIVHLPVIPKEIVDSILFSSAGSHLYEFKVTDNNAARVQDIANALADNFVKAYRALTTRQAQNTVNVLQQQLKDADSRLAQARRRYDDYRNAHHVVGTITAVLDAAVGRLRAARAKEEDNMQKQADLDARLLKTRIDIEHLTQGPVPTAQGGKGGNLRDEVLVQAQLDRITHQLKDLNDRYTDEMPIVRRTEEERQKLADQLEAIRNGKPLPSTTSTTGPDPTLTAMQQQERLLQQEIAGMEATGKAIKASIAQAQADVDQYKGIDSPLATLAADMDTLSEARASLALRTRNAAMLKDASEIQDPITIVSRADKFNPPLNTGGSKVKLLIMAGIGSLLVSVGVVVGREVMDRRIRTVQQAEQALPAPVIVAIPQPAEDLEENDVARVTQLFPQSLQSETFRFLALFLLNQQDPPIRSLMICSARAAQGTTTTLANLGITLAQAGKRVILVDANIRTPRLHEIFGLTNESGYTNLLLKPDQTNLYTALRDTDLNNLMVICSGTPPDNPWEMFRSQNIYSVSQQLLDHADYVLYDTPSSVLFTDALNLGPIVDAAFLCVRAMQPVTSAEDRLVNLLQDADIPVLGYVLNDMPADVVEGYNTYQYYYTPTTNGAETMLPNSIAPGPDDI